MTHGRPAKRRKVTPPIDDDVVSHTVKASDLLSRVADWDLEEAYEQRSRGKKVKETSRLPTKSLDGLILKSQVSAPQGESDSDADSFLASDSEDEAGNGLATPPSEVEVKPTIPIRQQISEAKEEIARLASLLNEDPEEHASAFKKLSQLADNASVPVRKLVLAAQVAVYKDAIPGYRIRVYRDEDLGNKVSKEVRQTRQYEQSLVTSYGSYVKHLAQLAKLKSHDSDELTLRTVAVSCACSLLQAVPHFNYRAELLGIISQQLLNRKSTPDFLRCIETVKALFESDDDGDASLETVTIIAKVMRAKDFRVREEVLDCFLHLRLLSELAPVRDNESADNSRPMERVHGKKAKKQIWEHRTKKEKKVAKERKAVEKDMREADASVNHEEREKAQSEALKAVFATYFRVLKARTPHLMGAVLEGLAKYAHLINQDMFGDILEALKDIVKQAEEGADYDEDDEDDAAGGRNFTRESLLATQTAFTLLSQQDVAKSAGALQLDLSFFSSHIYRTLYSLGLDADIELGPKALHLADPHDRDQSSQRNRVNVSTPVLLLARVINSLLLTPSQPPPTMTATAFYKRLLTVSLQVPEKSALAVLNLMERIADKHVRKVEPLWYSDERKGDGVFHGESDTIEGTNILAMGSGVWEQELLKKHYCPKVRDQVAAINKIVVKNSQK